MLEVGKCPEMEHYQDGHDFTVRERCFTMTETDAGRGYEKDMSSPMVNICWMMQSEWLK